MMVFQTVNIACLPLTPAEVTQVLDEIATVIQTNHHCRAMKVIHGFGGISRDASLKKAVRTWAERNRKYLKGVIPGENYNGTNPTLLEMQKTCGEFSDPDLGEDNSGVTVIWVA